MLIIVFAIVFIILIYLILSKFVKLENFTNLYAINEPSLYYKTNNKLTIDNDYFDKFNSRINKFIITYKNLVQNNILKIKNQDKLTLKSEQIRNIIDIFIQKYNNVYTDQNIKFLKLGNIESNLIKVDEIQLIVNLLVIMTDNLSVQRLTIKFIINQNYIIIDSINTYTDNIDLNVQNKFSSIFPFEDNDLGLINNNDNVIITDDLIKESTRFNKLNNDLRDAYTCLGTVNSNNFISKEDCVSFNGVWDKPVQNNYKCPYYKKNINYPNNRGQVNVGGYCELPSGLLNKGYRYSDDTTKPLCYNCKEDLVDKDNPNSTLGYCCDKQQTNYNNNYSNLKSPDYKFNGDLAERTEYKSLLYQNNLQIV